MRKLFSVMAALLVLLSLACPALADANTSVFYKSVDVKDAPTLTSAKLDGETVAVSHLVITSVGQAKDGSTAIPADSKTLLLDVYEQLNNKPQTVPMSSGYVVRDLFDVSFTNDCTTGDDHASTLAQSGKKITLTLNNGLAKNTKVEVFYFKDNKWNKASSASVSSSGVVTCVLEDICPVAICVPKYSDTTSAKTGDQAFPAVWIGVMVAAAVALVALVLLRKKLRK